MRQASCKKATALTDSRSGCCRRSQRKASVLFGRVNVLVCFEWSVRRVDELLGVIDRDNITRM